MEKIKINQPKQIKSDELKKIRRFFHLKMNKGRCPILGYAYADGEMVVDHAHTANSINLGREFEAGLIRGVIHRQANTMEGKITNAFIRCGLHKFDITLPDFLRNLADFIENPPMTHLKYKHPGEKDKALILKKNSVKKLAKMYAGRYPNRKTPEVFIYKKKRTKKGKMKEVGKKLTAGLEKLYLEFGILPEFKKGK